MIDNVSLGIGKRVYFARGGVSTGRVCYNGATRLVYVLLLPIYCTIMTAPHDDTVLAKLQVWTHVVKSCLWTFSVNFLLMQLSETRKMTQEHTLRHHDPTTWSSEGLGKITSRGHLSCFSVNPLRWRNMNMPDPNERQKDALYFEFYVALDNTNLSI